MNKIKNLLLTSNFISRIDIKLKAITKDDLAEFEKEYNVKAFYSSRVDSLLFENEKGETITNFKTIFNGTN